jgi:hypothetical protein
MSSLRQILAGAVALFAVGCTVDHPTYHDTGGSAGDPAAGGGETLTLVSRSGEMPAMLDTPDPSQPSGGGEPAGSVEPAGSWEVVDTNGGKAMVYVVDLPTDESKHALDGYLTTSSSMELVRSPMASKPVMAPMDPSVGGAGGTTNEPAAGLLTAGEWHDHANWEQFRTFIREYPEHFDAWRLDLQRRVVITVVDEEGAAVPGATVTIASAGEELVTAVTVADGKVAFFPRAEGLADEELVVSVAKGGITKSAQLEAVEDDDQEWSFRLDGAGVDTRPMLDVAFVVDVTGSMSDELRYLHAEVQDICEKIFSNQVAGLRVGLVFYRDRGDEFVTNAFDFSASVVDVRENLGTMQAAGGGDFPESMNLALKEAMQSLSWQDGDAVRLCFLVADAPPHYYADEQYTYREALEEAVGLGIKIIPVSGSGIDRSTEYLMRHMAVKTLGRYIFLTDDSGIGGSHLDPDIEEYEVETLNDLIVRTVTEELMLWPQ